MDIILIVLTVLLVGIASTILYLNLRPKSKDENENKETEEIANLKNEIVTLKDTLNNTINTSLGTMSTSFNNLSTGVTKDKVLSGNVKLITNTDGFSPSHMASQGYWQVGDDTSS